MSHKYAIKKVRNKEFGCIADWEKTPHFIYQTQCCIERCVLFDIKAISTVGGGIYLKRFTVVQVQVQVRPFLTLSRALKDFKN